MTAFGQSQTVNRIEDLRLLTGQGRYIDDSAPPDALHAVFLRAPVAHARIVRIDPAAARAAPGVQAVLTGHDLIADGVRPMPASLVRNQDGSQGAAPARHALAPDRVRHVGEAVAMVVADTRAQAQDAAELIAIDYAELPVALALAEGGPRIHPEAPGNLAFDWALGDGPAVEAGFARAAHRIALRVSDNRIIANPMEPRGAWADWRDGRLTLCHNGQNVWRQKAQIVASLGLPEDAVRVTNALDVGGGFGTKAMGYPEYVAIAAAARRLGRPLRWMSDRTEAMLTDNAGRDLVSLAELAFDEGHRIIAYRVDIAANLGAYNSQFGQLIQSQIASRVLTGVYDIPAAHVRARGYYTNTTPVDAYRGAGRPEAIYTLERLMDRAARELGRDPAALRRLNFIPPDRFPYATPAGETYDVGDFDRVLTRALAEADAAGLAARRAAARARGRLRGLGLCCYIEAVLGDPVEMAQLDFDPDGGVTLRVGTQSNGQGHETVFRRFLADRTGIPAELIRVAQGDSDALPQGGGTGGSRSVTIQSMATDQAVGAAVAALAPFLAEALEVPADAVVFDGAAFRATGSNRAPGLIEAAAMARAAGREDLSCHRAQARLPGRSFPNGAHLAEVEIDPETGVMQVVRYTVTDDFGNLMHPRLVEGQVHGGIAQGLGQALREHCVFDDAGQLLTASFMDYALPRAEDMPRIRFFTEPLPSTANPLGMKGCGEAGTVGALAAIANAVQDALWPLGIRAVDMPFTPLRLWQMISDAGAGATSGKGQAPAGGASGG